MTAQVHRRRVGDLRTVLPVTLQQPDSTGTGVTVVTAASGTVNYDFSSTGVDAAGVYWGTFLVTESGQTDAVPVRAKDLKIIIDSDTQTGEEAYAAAVAGQ